MNKGLWYFAHPYTVKDKDDNYLLEGEEANFRLCNYRASRLLLAGYNIYSPISHTHPIQIACPEFLGRQEHEMWYHLDEHLIGRTNFDGIILAPGWSYSKGCCQEHDIFVAERKIVLLYSDIIKE